MRSRAWLVGLLTAAWLAVLQAVSFAQNYPGGGDTPPPTVGGTKFFDGKDKLPKTGADVLMIILIALLVLLLGLALHRLSRRAPARDN